MEQIDVNAMKDQAKDFAKASAKGINSSLITCLKKAFCFKGRATRMEYWSFLVGCVLFNIAYVILAGILCWILRPAIFATILGAVGLLANLFLVICLISVSVRRLHDLGLTGFWLWYLSPTGLPVVFMVSLLDLDESCKNVLDRIAKTCTNWVSWFFLPLFWFLGAPVAQFLLFLYAGKDEANQFGPSPYSQAQAE